MKVEGSRLSEIIKLINTFRPNGKDSLNVIIRLSDDKLLFSIASRDYTVSVKNGISIAEGTTDIVMKTAIGIDIGLLSSIASEVKKDSIDMKIGPLEGSNFHTIEISSSSESFKITGINIPTERMGEVVPIVSGIDRVLIANEKAELLMPAATVIRNISALCPDNQFKCMVYRKGKKITFVYITATTISYFNAMLTSDYENETVMIDTKTPIFSSLLENMLTSSEDMLSISVSDQVVLFSNSRVEICSSYIKSEKPTEESIKSFESTQNAILAIKNTVLKFRFNSTKMIKTMSKASIMAVASKASKLVSLLPFEISDPKSVHIKFKDAPGEYQTKFTDDVVVDIPSADTLKAKPYNFVINLPMITSMVGAISEINGNSAAEIELRENDSNTTYVIVRPHQGHDLGYLLRLKK